MARRSKSARIFDSGNSNDWRSRVHHVSLSPSDEAEIAEWWGSQNTSWWTLCEELVDDYWAVKITGPGSRDAYWCSVSCKRDGADWDGHTFIVSYPDLAGSVVLAYFIIRTWLEEGRITTRAKAFLDKGENTP